MKLHKVNDLQGETLPLISKLDLLELKLFFEKLAISQKLQEISKCCQKDFLKIKNKK